MKRVVVVGGGFGGLRVSQRLASADVAITLVDRRNHHLFQPLLYQVATAALSPGDIAEPIRHIVARQSNVEVVLGEVTAVDTQARVVKLVDRDLPYDVLVLAAGARHSYFGNDRWGAYAPGLKTVGDALEIRRKMLLAFEHAEWCADPVERARLLTFIVIGGGPTGVEMAGAIAEIARHTMRRDFRHIDTRAAQVLLIEASDLLNGYPDDLRKSAENSLRELGVDVRLGQRVLDIDARGVTLADGRIDAANIVWAAGVQGEAVAKTLGVPLDRGGRVKVSPDLTIPEHPEVFVIGDLAAFEQDGGQLPGVAPVALQMADLTAANIQADLAGQTRRPFLYRNLGKMATIGRSHAVAEVPVLGRWSGHVAWILWAFVHIAALVAFRNRVVVFSKWLLSYVTYDRGSRLVWQDEWERFRGGPGADLTPSLDAPRSEPTAGGHSERRRSD